MQLAVIDQNFKSVSNLTLSDEMGEKLNKAVLYYGVKALRSNLRHGTVKVKTRSEVERTGKKVYKQKGTGNARHGSRRANIYVGGGNVHGPQPRSYNEKINKKFKSRCYHEIFKFLIQSDSLKVVSEFNFAKPSTKDAVKFLKGVGFDKKALVLLPTDAAYKNAELSFRNVKDVKVLSDININFFDLLKYSKVVVLQKTFENLKERYAL